MRRFGFSTGFAIPLVVAVLLTHASAHKAHSQTYTWNNGNIGDASVDHWRVPNNWTPNDANSPPGLEGLNTNAEVAAWAGTGNNIASVGIDMQVPGSDKAWSVGAISVTSLRTNNLLIGNNSNSQSGTLRLNGATINAQANTIFANFGGSSASLTIQNVQGFGNRLMPLSLGNTTSFVQLGAGTASAFGNSIIISSAIGQTSAGSSITVLGNGTTSVRGGTLQLSGSNTFTGGMTIGNLAGTSAARVTFETIASMPTAGNITVNPNSQLRLEAITGTYGSSSQTISITSSGAAPSGGDPSWGAIRYDPAGSNRSATLATAVALAGDSVISVNGSANNLTISGPMSGNFGLTKEDAGTLTFSDANSGYVGSTRINNGTLTVNSGSNLGSGALVMGADSGANAVTLNLNNASQSIGSLSQGTANVTRTINLATNHSLTITQTSAGDYGGTITGTGASVTLGSGSNNALTLSGSNTYTGGTVINGGTLYVTNATGSATGTNSVSVNSGGTLGGNNAGAISGAVTVASGGTLAPGTTASTGTLKVNNNVTFNSGANFSVRSTSATNYDSLLVTSGNVSLNGLLSVNGSGTGYSSTDKLWIVDNTGAGLLTGTFSNFSTGNGEFVATFGGFDWGIFYNADHLSGSLTGGNDVVLTPVPEPVHLTMFSFGIIGAAGSIRRLRRRWNSEVGSAAVLAA